VLIEVSLRFDDVCDEITEFSSSAKAEAYFYKLARQRTRYPSKVIATVDGEWRMIYRIDELYSSNRWELSLDLHTGLPVSRRYIPSTDELTGRKSRVSGVLLPPIKVNTELYAQLQERATRAGKTITEIRKQAYRNFVNESDTILLDILQ
jgi:sugar-specific transcriptional regulator TrmB